MFFLYNFILEALFGWTLAKTVVDVVTIREGGKRVSIPMALVRSIFKTFYLAWGCSLCWMQWSSTPMTEVLWT
jgi:hypothetical protein